MATRIEIGYDKGEQCNRNGCDGILEENDSSDSCSCHINPPCSYCTTNRCYCEKCGWDGEDEQYEPVTNESNHEDWYRKYRESRELFYNKFNGKIPAEKLEIRKESHTHFSMKVYGVHPPGYDLKNDMDKIRGTFGGRFEMKSPTSFIYIAYTD